MNPFASHFAMSGKIPSGKQRCPYTRRRRKHPAADARQRSAERPKDVELPECYQLLVDCRDENDQRELYERLISTGYSCRVLTL
jgi:hypothetical protein